MTFKSVDVASYILRHKGEMTTMKLQKLVFYSHVWSLVLDGRPLIREQFQAWRDGPVEPYLFGLHRGKHYIFALTEGRPDVLDLQARERVNQVLSTYGRRSAEYLSELTHSEKPWLDARGVYDSTAASGNFITNESIVKFYSKEPVDDLVIDAEVSLANISPKNLALIQLIMQNSHTDHLSEEARREELSKQIGSSLRIEGVEMSDPDVLGILNG